MNSYNYLRQGASKYAVLRRAALSYAKLREVAQGSALVWTLGLLALVWYRAGTIFALFLIYALIAIPLRSYLQPLLIMSVIPFGTIGAVFGHWILGIPVSLLSMFGIIALAGVVVNDSLILVDFVNHHRKKGESRIDAALKGAKARFRPIILTSATTFLGLAPIVFFEKSLQAQLVVPMAASLSSEPYMPHP